MVCGDNLSKTWKWENWGGRKYSKTMHLVSREDHGDPVVAKLSDSSVKNREFKPLTLLCQVQSSKLKKCNFAVFVRNVWDEHRNLLWGHKINKAQMGTKANKTKKKAIRLGDNLKFIVLGLSFKILLTYVIFITSAVILSVKTSWNKSKTVVLFFDLEIHCQECYFGNYRNN